LEVVEGGTASALMVMGKKLTSQQTQAIKHWSLLVLKIMEEPDLL
jgi:hypothetical protein